MLAADTFLATPVFPLPLGGSANFLLHSSVQQAMCVEHISVCVSIFLDPRSKISALHSRRMHSYSLTSPYLLLQRRAIK
jgi:hypothetical protein